MDALTDLAKRSISGVDVMPPTTPTSKPNRVPSEDAPVSVLKLAFEESSRMAASKSLWLRVGRAAFPKAAELVSAAKRKLGTRAKTRDVADMKLKFDGVAENCFIKLPFYLCELIKLVIRFEKRFTEQTDFH